MRPFGSTTYSMLNPDGTPASLLYQVWYMLHSNNAGILMWSSLSDLLLALEIERGQRRQAQGQGILEPHPRHRLGHHAAAIAIIAARVVFGVAVEDFAVITGLGDAHAIILARHRCEIRDDHNEFLPVSRPPDEGEHAVIGIVAVDPLKSLPLEIHFVQRRFPPVGGVQIGHQMLQPLMLGITQQVPFQARALIPL